MTGECIYGDVGCTNTGLISEMGVSFQSEHSGGGERPELHGWWPLVLILLAFLESD